MYFDSDMFKDFCHQVRMKVTFASVYHPQSNGVVERANTLIFEAIKKSLKVKRKASEPK
jgi:IS30 family transposase